MTFLAKKRLKVIARYSFLVVLDQFKGFRRTNLIIFLADLLSLI